MTNLSEPASEDVVLQRVVFPLTSDPNALPLYLDPETWTWDRAPMSEDERLARSRGITIDGLTRSAVRLSGVGGLEWISGRRSISIPAEATVSFGSYFNAFPASYWASWTNLTGVRLRLRTQGAAHLIVYRSNARGIIQRVDGAEVDGEAETEFNIPFTSFIDGGWLWFDVSAGKNALELVQADWLAPIDAQPRSAGRATISITTLNRGEYCSKLLKTIGDDQDAMSMIDGITVVDQGNELISAHPGFPAAKESLGTRLRVIEQANLGGSGGFARGMLETVDSGTSEYVLLLDDDVEAEPESIRRAVMFANFCRTPTLVGGHMLDMYDKSKLHAFAEGIKWDPFIWGPFTPDRHDFTESNLRQTNWMHRRFDVDYNGWWMTLIPVETLKTVGLSMPFFIKWDDAEYSLRAREAGFSTVSLPGVAVWHVSWVDKDDTHDWQAFYHTRNRLVAALLHSPMKRGGKLWRANLASDIKNLFTMDYYTVAMRHAAIRAVFKGPEHLHAELDTRLSKVRALGKEYSESALIRGVDGLPHFPAHEITSVTRARLEAGPRGVSLVVWLVRTAFRHSWISPSILAREAPQAHLAYQDARWFAVPNHDSVLITNAEGSGATWHLRRPDVFRRMLRDSISLNLRYRRDWARLSQKYRDAAPSLAGLATWRDTFDEKGAR